MTKKKVKTEIYAITQANDDRVFASEAEAVKMAGDLVRTNGRPLAIWKRTAIIKRKDNLEIING